MNMIENKKSLNIRNKQIFDLLNSWLEPLYGNYEHQNIDVHFHDRLFIGQGMTEYDGNGLYHINIGIAPLSRSFLARNQIIKDSDFIKMGVTMFHEIAHYERSISDETPIEILISDLSKYNNDQFYLQHWHRLPHEIDAEYTGVITMWEHLETIYPNDADRLMIKYLTDRATLTNYMIDVPEDGFRSREQVETLFDTAYDSALNDKQVLPKDFLRSNDEIAKLLTTDERIIRTEYYPFYDQLMTAKTGQELNLKMASLSSYLHPELQNAYQKLDFSKLEPLIIFGIPIPGASETADFTKAIESMSVGLNQFGYDV